MKVLVVGQGGREHVLVWKLAQSPLVEQVFAVPGNAGTGRDGTNVDLGMDDFDRLIKFAQTEQIDLTVIGPEAPLVDGIVDAFQDAGLKVFGPNKAAALLEGSKVFSKRLMRSAKVPTAEFHAFQNSEEAEAFIQDRGEQPWVIKADGLAAGKGVLICHTKAEALEAIRTIMVEHSFGQAGQQILIEELLEGQETSVLAIVDGGTIIPLESSQDHKRAYDDDQGPNTGGMWAYSPAPLVSDQLMDEIIENILIPTVHTMKRQGRPFRGVLYAGLMITNQGPRVLEYNVRFGDPEAQPVLMRLKTDLAKLLLAAADGRLKDIGNLEWDDRSAVCVVMASDGYPGPYEKGLVISGLDEAAALQDVKVFHAGTAIHGDQVVTNGGRVLGVTALGENVGAAKLRAYQAVKCIRWNGAWCRKDISDKAR